MRISDWSSDVCSADLSTCSNAQSHWAGATASGSRTTATWPRCTATRASATCLDASTDGRAGDARVTPASILHRVAPPPRDPRGHRLCGGRLGHRRGGLHGAAAAGPAGLVGQRSEEHTSELQSLMRISYAVFCLKKKNKHEIGTDITT